MPRTVRTSLKFSPAARTATRTWPGANGSHTSGHGRAARSSIVPLPVVSSRHASPVAASSAATVASWGASTAPARTATCGRSAARARASIRSSDSSASTSTNRPGFSDWAERIRPHTAACTGSGRSASPVATAPRVSTTSRASPDQRCTAASTRSSTARRSDRTSPSASGARSTTTSGAGLSAARSYGDHDGDGGSSGTATGVHSTRCSAAVAVSPAASWSRSTSRITSASAVSTAAPVVSATSTDMPFSPRGLSRTRAAVAPVACRETPDQEKGNAAEPSSPAATAACSAASNNAGCSPNPSGVTVSGRATSANTSPARRHTRRRPWNTGP